MHRKYLFGANQEPANVAWPVNREGRRNDGWRLVRPVSLARYAGTGGKATKGSRLSE
jgi:hypothetical protein